MNKEKMKLAMKLAQENPNLDIDTLFQLIDTEKEEMANGHYKVETPVEIEVKNEDASINKSKSKKSRKIWSSNDINTLIVLYNQGLSREEVGKILNRTRQSIASKIRELRYENRIPTSNKRSKGVVYTEQEKNILRSILSSYNNEPRLVPLEVLEKTAIQMKRTANAVLTTLYNIRNREELYHEKPSTQKESKRIADK